VILENGWLIINTHLSFVPFFNYRQLKQIKRWANKLGVAPEKVLLMGDFNIPSRKNCGWPQVECTNNG
jgi:endonuclease/exonuclease/phosphatase family metal-dependent hydrolase